MERIGYRRRTYPYQRNTAAGGLWRAIRNSITLAPRSECIDRRRLPPKHGGTPEVPFPMAGQALHRAKQPGRNIVASAGGLAQLWHAPLFTPGP